MKTKTHLATLRFAKEGVEGIIFFTNGLVGGHGTIRVDTMFKAVQFPALITNLKAKKHGEQLCQIFVAIST